MLSGVRLANSSDIENIVELVNLTYRPADANISWTNETRYMTGNRISHGHVRDILINPNCVILMLYEQTNLIACVLIEKDENAAKIGLLTVQIDKQQLGYGKKMLELAEKYAVQRFCVAELKMHVLTIRPELIDFYVRRGYERTDIIRPYPTQAGYGRPKVSNLEFEILKKQPETS